MTKIHQCECDICKTKSDPEIVQHHQTNLFLSRLNEPQRRWYVGLLSQKWFNNYVEYGRRMERMIEEIDEQISKSATP